jgi:hypothetical protein
MRDWSHRTNSANAPATPSGAARGYPEAPVEPSENIGAEGPLRALPWGTSHHIREEETTERDTARNYVPRWG